MFELCLQIRNVANFRNPLSVGSSYLSYFQKKIQEHMLRTGHFLLTGQLDLISVGIARKTLL